MNKYFRNFRQDRIVADERMQNNFDFNQKSVLMKRGNSLDIRHRFLSFSLRSITIFTVSMLL